jgi:iron complex outermembrane receptor protein
MKRIFSTSRCKKYAISICKLKGHNFPIAYSHQSSRNTLTNGLTLPAFFVAQAGLGYVYKKIKVGLNIDNIFNTSYWVGGYNYASKWPGMPRNVMCTVGYKF